MMMLKMTMFMMMITMTMMIDKNGNQQLTSI